MPACVTRPLNLGRAHCRSLNKTQLYCISRIYTIQIWVAGNRNTVLADLPQHWVVSATEFLTSFKNQIVKNYFKITSEVCINHGPPMIPLSGWSNLKLVESFKGLCNQMNIFWRPIKWNQYFLYMRKCFFLIFSLISCREKSKLSFCFLVVPKAASDFCLGFPLLSFVDLF